jgi:membrane protein
LIEPSPEVAEQPLRRPGLTDLSLSDARAALLRAVSRFRAEQFTDVAAGLAYHAFMALPAVLLLSLGVFSLLAGRDTVDALLERVEAVAPTETVVLLEDSLDRTLENQGGGLAMILVGGLVALWALSGAMSALARGLNRAYQRDETRGFVRERAVALGMFVLVVIAAGASAGLLVAGPHLSRWLGSAVGLESLVAWIWWGCQWPVLIVLLLAAIAGVLYLGPDVDQPRWTWITPGSLVAVVLWLSASGLFAAYVSMFGSYNKAWGTLAAVIILLTWLWISGLSILLAGLVNAEVERSRELRAGLDAEAELRVPPTTEG